MTASHETGNSADVMSGTPTLAERPSAAALTDRVVTNIGGRLADLMTGGAFDAVNRHILAVPGKRVRARLVLACADLLPSTPTVSPADALDLACALEMIHEASLVHDDICDGSLLRRGAPSVAARFGVRTAARAGFHLAGNAFHVLARVISDNPVVFARLGEAHGVTYLDQLADLSPSWSRRCRRWPTMPPYAATTNSWSARRPAPCSGCAARTVARLAASTTTGFGR
jgi:hypothetical protein